jgi:hypothetical protein
VCIYTDPISALTRNFHARLIYPAYTFHLSSLSLHLHAHDNMADPKPIQNRSKRSLSPSAASPPRDRTRFASYSDKPFSNTPKSAPTDPSATRAKMIALEPYQKDELLKTLFDLHPSARESITAILPAIITVPAPENMVTKSVYFVAQIARCHNYLLTKDWPRYPDLPVGTCMAVHFIMRDLFRNMENQIERFDENMRMNLLDPVCSRGVYLVDAATALLDAGHILIKRRRRLADYAPSLGVPPCSPGDCLWHPPYHYGPTDDGYNCRANAAFSDLASVLTFGALPFTPDEPTPRQVNDEATFEREGRRPFLKWEQYHIAVRYATCDNRAHPLREAILKYTDLPPILPQLGPNDNAISEPDDWLRPCLEKLALLIRKREIPEIGTREMSHRISEPVLDLGGMSMN